MRQRFAEVNRAIEQERSVWGPALLCKTSGCGRVVEPGSDMCVDCVAMDRELDHYFSESQKMKRLTIATRLQNVAWLLAFMALAGALAYELWPYIWAIFELWFGGQ